MFCMNCGQQLPDGAKFCLQCGTPQGAVSPIGTPQAETINLDGAHTFVPAMCPNCNAHMKVDSSSKIARCDSCATECLVQDAIKALTIRGNVQVGSATINVNGTNTESLLRRVEIMLADGDFSGAMSKCDTILDSDPTNGKVYFFMLMADLHCKSKKELAKRESQFDDNQYYIKAIQFGDEDLKTELLGYSNSAKARVEANLKRMAEVGKVFAFGKYKGDVLRWKILKKQDDRVLVISFLNIVDKPYHQSGHDVTWSQCTLHKWLNTSFFIESFSTIEKSRIIPCEIRNDINPKYKTLGGNPTNDRVFLLSVFEANTLFAQDKERKRSSEFWLRSPGSSSSYAATMDYFGKINFSGSKVDSTNIGVRPVMWIKLDS